MQITQKLLSFLHRVFDKGPKRFLALRVSYDGSMTWSLRDGILTTRVADGPGQSITVDVRQYTIAQLATHIATLPGYFIPYVDSGENAQLSARCLIDASGSTATSNGDHLYGYTSILWAYLEATGSELDIAKLQVGESVRQMSTKTAAGEWLDELGDYYYVPRRRGETDASYGPRIISTVLRPRSNNIAIAAAIEEIAPGMGARIIDSTDLPDIQNLRDGSIKFDGTYRHYSGVVTYEHGLFDAEFNVDLTSGEEFNTELIIDLINRFRAAGTHLRHIGIVGHLMEFVNSGAWQEITKIDFDEGANGVAPTATTLAPSASAVGGAEVAAAGPSATSAAPGADAVELDEGEASAIIQPVHVSAPSATVSVRGSGTGLIGAASASPPGGVAAAVDTEMLNIELDAFSDAYVSQTRLRNGTLFRDGSEVYDSGGDEFELEILTD